jgi:hypothetical protein
MQEGTAVGITCKRAQRWAYDARGHSGGHNMQERFVERRMELLEQRMELLERRMELLERRMELLERRMELLERYLRV